MISDLQVLQSMSKEELIQYIITLEDSNVQLEATLKRTRLWVPMGGCGIVDKEKVETNVS